MIKEYRRTIKVFAVQYDGTNEDELIKFFDATKFDGELIIPTSFGSMPVKLDDWVIQDVPSYIIMNNKDFRERYKLV